ncbi:Ribonuclease D [Limihaloglobus sulfuriphilus]|uniref:Ribonuclease D n=1 Tax=Limihaloglobus sulfuriphilus TaxID=1851148 RepID=A0A1Q2MIA5_9BACT|nr:HRDC domain-containing protein [Limihaloglobus sulfuriphilus]AQQ72389.1 Ribonuclease D [Limihaloglobus sulfuriphilus]
MTVAYLYVDNDKTLQTAIEHIKLAERVAVDIEADSLHNYNEKVCLIQITTNGENFIIDPFAKMDLRKLLNLLKKKPLIFHGGDYDLRMLYHTYQFKPEAPVFDTKIAAQFMGMDQLGLATVIKELYNIKIDKAHQTSDWSKRPLSPTQLQYACLDTHFLHEIAEHYESKLKRKKRFDWYVETCERIAIAAIENHDNNGHKDPWRIKGYSKLHPGQLRYLKEVWQWREETAQKRDIPPFKVMRNEVMLLISKWAFHNPFRSVKRFRNLPKKLTDEEISSLRETIRKGKDVPKDQWPSQYRKVEKHRRSPSNKAIVAELKEKIEKKAKKMGLSTSTLITSRCIDKISRCCPVNEQELRENTNMYEWQISLMSKTIFSVVKKNTR